MAVHRPIGDIIMATSKVFFFLTYNSISYLRATTDPIPMSPSELADFADVTWWVFERVTVRGVSKTRESMFSHDNPMFNVTPLWNEGIPLAKVWRNTDSSIMAMRGAKMYCERARKPCRLTHGLCGCVRDSWGLSTPKIYPAHKGSQVDFLQTSRESPRGTGLEFIIYNSLQ